MRELIKQRIEEASKAKWSPKMNWEGWKLYEPDGEGEKKQAENAADALNAAMLKFEKELKKNLKGVSEYDTEVVGPIAGKLYDAVILPVHKKFRSIGANDTPVREISTVAAIQMVKSIYNKTGWTKLGDYVG